MLNYQQQDQWQPTVGKRQSPIDLKTTSTQVSGPLNIQLASHYQLTQVTDDQTTIKVFGQGEVELFDRHYQLSQCHFHHPAEHTVDQQTYPFEIHLVHQTEIGQLCVVALMVELGQFDPVLQAIIGHYQPAGKQDVSLPIQQWLPSRPTGFHYLGSLTTPPLTEGVEWLVITNPNIHISPKQLNWFQHTFLPNNRQIQNDNNRSIFYHI